MDHSILLLCFSKEILITKGSAPCFLFFSYFFMVLLHRLLYYHFVSSHTCKTLNGCYSVMLQFSLTHILYEAVI